MTELTIALAGNPNVGKSTIFNALTSSRQHVGNWPGKTVEKKAGLLRLGGREITVVDLPGTYSLSAYSIEEQIARDFIVRAKPQVVINVVDAANLERNLYLTAQILETGMAAIVVLNMLDLARTRGLEIDVEKLTQLLDSVQVVPMVASQERGLGELKQAIAAFLTRRQPTWAAAELAA